MTARLTSCFLPFARALVDYTILWRLELVSDELAPPSGINIWTPPLDKLIEIVAPTVEAYLKYSAGDNLRGKELHLCPSSTKNFRICL